MSDIPIICYLKCSSLVYPYQLPFQPILYRLVKPVVCGPFQGAAAMESEVHDFIMEYVIVCTVNTIARVPHIVCPLPCAEDG